VAVPDQTATERSQLARERIAMVCMVVGIVLATVGAWWIGGPGTGLATAGAQLVALALLLGWRT
jgi:uncharacterized membrane protein